MLPGRQLNKRVEPCNHTQLRWCTHAGNPAAYKPAAAPSSPVQSQGRELPLWGELGSKHSLQNGCRELSLLLTWEHLPKSRLVGREWLWESHPPAWRHLLVGFCCADSRAVLRRSSLLPYRVIWEHSLPLPCGYSSLTSPVSVILEWHHRELVS